MNDEAKMVIEQANRERMGNRLVYDELIEKGFSNAAALALAGKIDNLPNPEK